MVAFVVGVTLGMFMGMYAMAFAISENTGERMVYLERRTVDQ